MIFSTLYDFCDLSEIINLQLIFYRLCGDASQTTIDHSFYFAINSSIWSRLLITDVSHLIKPCIWSESPIWLAVGQINGIETTGFFVTRSSHLEKARHAV